MILDDMRDLHRQATEERSHHYTGSLLQRAIDEIERLYEVIRTLAPAGSRDETIVRKLTDYETAEAIYNR
jgi:hypothetical protein